MEIEMITKPREWKDHALEKAIQTLAIIIFIIAVGSSFANVDLLSPSQNSYVNQTEVTFEYFINNINATNCQLKIDNITNEESSNITEGFNTISTTLTLGNHTWQISCNAENGTQESEIRTTTIDYNPPTIVLFSPQNNAEIKSKNITLSFVALDNFAEEIPCKIIIDNSTTYNTTALNSQPHTLDINSTTDGPHTWQITCIDLANNTKTSEERNVLINTTEETPQFGMTISRREFLTGEQGEMTLLAPSDSSVRVEVCPDANGFVECTIPINIQNSSSYPITAGLPFLNKEGKYVLEAYFTYKNATETKTERYNVTSNIIINTDYTERPRKNEPVHLSASASGGVGSLDYTWTLSNSSKYYSRKANITYTSPGNYTNTITVIDGLNNSRNKTVTVEVSNSNSIKFIVKEEDTLKPISQAKIEIDSQEKDTDSNGEAVLYLRQGKKEILVMAQNYSIYQSDINITSDQTITLLLKPLNYTKPKPSITLTYPDNGTNIVGTTTEVGFKVSHKYESNCSIYISEENSSFFIYLGSSIIPPNDNSEKRFEIIELENMSYGWRVECVDTQKMQSISETRHILVGTKQQVAKVTEELTELNNLAKELETIDSDINNMPPELKESIEIIGFRQKLQESIKSLKNAIRDIDSLNYQNLDQQTLQSKKIDIIAKAQATYKSTPTSFELIESENFVDYIEKSDLEKLTKEYLRIRYGENTTINLNHAIKKLENLQQEALISTKIRTVRVTQKDGTTQEISAVIRELKTYNLTTGTILVEALPKLVAKDANEIKSSTKFQILAKDPMIAFPIEKDARIVFYLEKRVSKEDLKQIKTALFIDFSDEDGEYVTGFSITNMIPSGTKKLFVPIIIIILIGGLIIAIRYEGFKTVQYATYLVNKKNTLHYLNVVINDIKDNIQLGKIERAIELYEEAKVAYIDLPGIAKNDIYEEIAGVANGIQEYQDNLAKNNKLREINIMLSDAEMMLAEMQVTEAIQEYKKIETEYHQLNETEQEAIHPHIVDLGNKIQVLIESNKKQRYE